MPAKRLTRTTPNRPYVRSRDHKALVPGSSQDSQEISRYEVREHLKSLVSNERAPAAARVNAARTLAEMDGLIGRHQVLPERDTPSLATLSRDALIEELERLRTAVELGIVS